MSTSNDGLTGIPSGGATLPEGAPSAGLVAQLANALFAVKPGYSAPPGASMASSPPATPPLDVGALPPASAIPPASALVLPGEADLRPVPTSLAGVSGLPAPAVNGLPDESPAPLYAFSPELVPDPGLAAPSALTGLSAQPATPAAGAGSIPLAPAVPPVSAYAPATASDARALPAAAAGFTGQSPPALANPESAPYFLEAAQAPRSAAPLSFPAFGLGTEMLPDLGLFAVPFDGRTALPEDPPPSGWPPGGVAVPTTPPAGDLAAARPSGQLPSDLDKLKLG